MTSPTTWISATRALTPRGVLDGPVWVSARDGRIADVRWGEAPPDAPSPTVGTLSPGLIDLQCNGGLGINLGATDAGNWLPWRHWLAAGGVTSVAPTFTTGPLDTMLSQVESAYRLANTRPGSTRTGARLLGAHLEGPFISPNRLGAHRARWRRDPTETHLAALGGLPPGALSIVTLAPELPAAEDLIAAVLGARAVAAIGHSDATAELVHRAADLGASMVTHVGNAQRGLHQREPGVLGAALIDDRLAVGLIGDRTHVHPGVIELCRRAAPGRCVLVTDAVAEAGLTAEAPRILTSPDADGGTPVLAGGVQTGAMIVAGLISEGFDAGWVLDAFTRAPAHTVSRDDLGTIEVGGWADLVLWDADWSVRTTWIAGDELNRPLEVAAS
ncbi:MAG: amidohydrolase family protein [Microthrixaceae bacterium]|nr:amidohydrolase family protein [Microthrixaceae bacterium]